MGYQIQYEPQLNKKYRISLLSKRSYKWLLWCGVVACFAVLAAMPTVRYWVMEFLIPGDSRVTTVAFSKMVSDLHDGSSVADAAAAFCQEILSYG